jgi:hypothetical protein
MSSFFRKATLRRTKLRLALIGPSGSGKTFAALTIGSKLISTLASIEALDGNGRTAVADSENGSSSLYSDVFDFDLADIDDFAPESYIEFLKRAAAESYSVTVVDSISHEWAGRNGVLEFKSRLEETSRGRYNSFTAWNQASPKHNAFVDALVRHPTHLICTVRAKQDYQVSQGPSGLSIQKLGLGPVQRDSTEYEFDVVASLEMDHSLMVTKSRCRHVSDRRFAAEEVGDFAAILGQWVGGTAGLEEAKGSHLSPEQLSDLKGLGAKLGMKQGHWIKAFTQYGVSSFQSLLPEHYEEIRSKLQAALAARESGRQA